MGNGYKKGATPPNVSNLPSGRFNPYEYIDYSDYTVGRIGNATYEEDLAMLKYYAELAQQDWQNDYNEAMLADERAYNERMLANERAYNERITKEEREYNSPANQVALMRAAGLNPDLMGTDFISGNGIPSPNPSNPVSKPSVGLSAPGDNVSGGATAGSNHVSNIVSLIGAVAETAMSMTNGAVSLQGLGMRNLSNSVGALDTIVNSALWNWENEPNIGYILNSAPIPENRKNKIRKLYEGVKGSHKRFIQGNRGLIESNESQKDLELYSRNPYNIVPNDPAEYDAWSKMWQPLIDKQVDIMKRTLDVEKENLDFDYMEKQFQKELREPFRKVIDDMSQKYHSGSEFYGWALSALYALMSSGGFSFSRSSGPKGVTNSFGFR